VLEQFDAAESLLHLSVFLACPTQAAAWVGQARKTLRCRTTQPNRSCT
jgi:hypothetical protein